jgi:hypothetical protein
MITPEQLATSGSEGGEQSALFCWAGEHKKQQPLLALMFHIPNGGERSGHTGARLRAMGTKRGVPDICLPVARGRFHGLFIEMKKLKSKESDLRTDQRQWMKDLAEQGYHVTRCNGWIEAKDYIIWYLSIGGYVRSVGGW